jgi:hypothetical protein
LLSVVKKNFKNPQFAESIGVSKQEGNAAAYLQGAFLMYAISELIEAKSYLCKALRYNPQLADESNQVIYNEIVKWANSLINKSLDINPIRFVDTVLENMPTELHWLSSMRRKIVAHIYVNKAFEAYQTRKYLDVLRFIPMAIFNYPMWLNNRGLISIGIRSIIRISK